MRFMMIVGNAIEETSNASPSVSAPQNGNRGAQGSLFFYTFVALGLALFIRFFIAAPFIVSGASMVPTFDTYHYLIIDRVSYELGEPHRGDVIVFDLPSEESRSLIKRVIGLPGETVVIRGDNVIVVNDAYPDGFTLDESYLDPENLGGPSDMRVTLAEGEYFVLGDNRRVSSDSRFWGVLPREDIVGRAFVRLYPFTKINVFPGNARYEE